MTCEPLFISLEGIEGAGKSTAMNTLTQFFKTQSVDYLETREPGGTPLSEKIRDIILSDDQVHLDKMSELMLIFSARSHHLESLIKPALSQGQLVISDRFTDATYAYQGAGRGIPFDVIASLEKAVQGELQPDYTFLLDVPVHLGFERVRSRGFVKDKMESESFDFFNRVRDCYLQRAELEPNRFIVIDGSRSISQVRHDLLNHLNKIYQYRGE